jgi:hypothetical protein
VFPFRVVPGTPCSIIDAESCQEYRVAYGTGCTGGWLPQATLNITQRGNRRQQTFFGEGSIERALG